MVVETFIYEYVSIGYSEMKQMGKKVVCPKCGKEISYLWDFSKVENRYRFEIFEGEVDYELVDSYSLNEIDEWECPECTAVLFTDEEEAARFLRGEKNE